MRIGLLNLWQKVHSGAGHFLDPNFIAFVALTFVDKKKCSNTAVVTEMQVELAGDEAFEVVMLKMAKEYKDWLPWRWL